MANRLALEFYMMNERIQKLIEDAGFILWEDEAWGPGAGRIDWSPDYTEELNRLIELIVKECASVAWNSSHSTAVTDRLRMSISSDIKRHFGVSNSD